MTRTQRAVRAFFIAGTDTGVGKTLWSSAFVGALGRAGHAAIGMKPVAAGAEVGPSGALRNEDALALQGEASVLAPYEDVNPYCFEAAVSPHLAAADAGQRIELARIDRAFERLARVADAVVIEGAGGWLAPIGQGATMADVAKMLRAPVILVVGLRLGCLNHAQLTARAIEASGLPFAGWVGNGIDPGFSRLDENVATLVEILGQAPLALIPHDPRATELEAAADRAAARLVRSKQSAM